jgi:glutamyl-tRNA synthetase
MSEVRVRFAPSPTGVLHLGGARTALFNWLYARHVGGEFLLRIEDTDHERSTDESTRAILDAMTWLGMTWDEAPVIQSSRLPQHKAALQKLIDEKKVYKCYCTPEEREAMREKALAAGKTFTYDGRCDGLPDKPGAPFVWRFRMPKEGETVVDDIVQGRVVTPNTEIEDLVIARSDGSPLYNFVVVIDDAFMRVTHVVRGKDHLTNTPKQIHIYRGLGLSEPKFAHLPLILGLSKRLRSAGIESYREQGYLPDAVNNYIARLGWSHGDQELFTTQELVEKFDLADVNRSEGALNTEKMEWINEQHIQRTALPELAKLAPRFLEKHGIAVDGNAPKLVAACGTVIKRAKTLVELADKMRFYFAPDDGLSYNADAKAKYLDDVGKARLSGMADALAAVSAWEEPSLEAAVKAFCDGAALKLKDVAQPTRVALTGEAAGPGLFETMVVLGRDSTLARLRRAAQGA